MDLLRIMLNGQRIFRYISQRRRESSFTAPGLHTMKTLFLLLFLLLPPALPSDGSLQDAVGLYEKGKFSQATSVFQQLSASTPSNAEVWVWLSRSRLKTRDWDRAVQAMEKAVQFQPTNAEYRLLARPCVRLPGIAFKFFDGDRVGSPGCEGIRNRKKSWRRRTSTSGSICSIIT